MARRRPLIDSTTLLSQPEQLRVHAADTGYLYLPGLLPHAEVDALRSELLSVAAAERHSWLAPGSDTGEGVAREGVFEAENIATPEYIAYYNEAQSLRRLHALPHAPALLTALEALFGEPPFVHPRHIAHVLFPLDAEMLRQRDNGELQGVEDHLTTCPHQDFWPVRGSAETWTAWVPLGDCEQDLGGIEIAAGSHRLGLFAGAPDDQTVRNGRAMGPDDDWHWSPTKSGDVLLFHSLVVHAGVHNRSGNRLRLALSARYQPASEPVDAMALTPHMNWTSWDEIYERWPVQDDWLKFYWKGHTPSLITRDDALQRLKPPQRGAARL